MLVLHVTYMHTEEAAIEFNLPILAILEKSTAEACQVLNLMGCTRELQDFLDCFRRNVWNMAIELGLETPTGGFMFQGEDFGDLKQTQRTQKISWKRCFRPHFGWIFVDHVSAYMAIAVKPQVFCQASGPYFSSSSLAWWLLHLKGVCWRSFLEVEVTGWAVGNSKWNDRICQTDYTPSVATSRCFRIDVGIMFLPLHKMCGPTCLAQWL